MCACRHVCARVRVCAHDYVHNHSCSDRRMLGAWRGCVRGCIVVARLAGCQAVDAWQKDGSTSDGMLVEKKGKLYYVNMQGKQQQLISIPTGTASRTETKTAKRQAADPAPKQPPANKAKTSKASSTASTTATGSNTGATPGCNVSTKLSLKTSGLQCLPQQTKISAWNLVRPCLCGGPRNLTQC